MLKMPVNQACAERLDPKLDIQCDKIVWQCSNCADNGEISHWRERGWVKLARDDMPRVVVVERKKKKPRKTNREKFGTLLLSKGEFTALKKVIDDTEIMDALEGAHTDSNDFAIKMTISQPALYPFLHCWRSFGLRPEPTAKNVG